MCFLHRAAPHCTLALGRKTPEPQGPGQGGCPLLALCFHQESTEWERKEG